jgi:hypothetical protein
VSQFIKDLPNHDARAFECRLAVADQRIGDDVFAKFEAFGLAVCSCLHIAAVEFRLAERGLQARRKNVVCRSEKTVNGQNAVRNLIAGTQQFYRLSQ